MADKGLGKKLGDKASKLTAPVVQKISTERDGMPGPSTNPATNIIIADIALRGAGRLVRNSLQKGMLRAGYDQQTAKDMVNNRTLASSLLLYGASKIATRSVPGALLVGGGLVLKTLYDRGMTRQKSRRKGTKQLKAMADDK